MEKVTNVCKPVLAVMWLIVFAAALIINSGCTATRVTVTPDGTVKASRISILQKVDASLSLPAYGTVDYNNDGGMESAKALVDTAIKAGIAGAATAAK